MAVADAKLRKDKSEPLFRQKDLLIILDGRSPTNTENMARELQRTLKEAAGLPARKYTVLRHFYSNTEFETGYCSPKRRTSIHPKVADPLENMFMVILKTFNMPFRESPAPTMVSDNSPRMAGFENEDAARAELCGSQLGHLLGRGRQEHR